MYRITAHRLRRTRRIIVATALAAVALPAVAQAADVTAAGTEIVVEDRVGRTGQPNRITAEALPGGELRLVDTVALVNKAASCVQVTALEPPTASRTRSSAVPAATRRRPTPQRRR